MKLTSVDMWASDASPHPDTVTEVGQYEFFSEEGAVLDVGKFVIVWTQEGGTWKAMLDMFNSNAPVQAQVAAV